MSFASRYIEKQVLSPAFIHDQPSADLGMIVMIPSCNEPELIKTIESLSVCQPPECLVEVIVLINEAEQCNVKISRQNEKTLKLLLEWEMIHPDVFFKLYPIYPAPFPVKHAGVGLARKTGMDEAVRRFGQLEKPDGVIVSLDADTLVEPNYLVEIDKLFSSEIKLAGTTISFRHRVEEIGDQQQREGIIVYETYLHYYKEALEYCGYPHAIYTIGSAFAVRACAYVKQGGMSQRQAGEDFYFLHKLTQLGQLAELNTTRVYPSARVSDRVPFGTGAALQKWMRGDSRLGSTYCFRSFTDLREFFRVIPVLYLQNPESVDDLGVSLPLKRFLKEDDFMNALTGIRSNSSSAVAFEKRFFQYFNAFKILKFQNFTHPQFYDYQDLNQAVADLKEAKSVSRDF
jgi:hypothetical protein